MSPRLLLVCCAIVAAVMSPVAVQAVESEASCTVSGVDYQSGTVTVTVQFAVPTARVRIASGTVALDTAATHSEDTSRSFGPVPITAPTLFELSGWTSAGARAWTCTLAVDPREFLPGKPRLSVPNGTVTGSPFSVRISAESPFTSWRSKISGDGGARVTTASVEPTSQVRLTGVRCPFGRATFSATVSNGFGASPSASVVVYNLGSGLPKKSRYVFVSKRILWMFYVRRGRVVDRWPIATGTRQTATPSGSFTIGRARPASGAWGVLRRRLYRDVKGRKNPPTRYYIHGTNAPWSIGTQASHGCVRMYNRDVREFARTVPTGTFVRIR